MYRVLKPGGYAQLIETGPEWSCGPKTASIVLFLDDFFGKRNMLLRCGVYVADMLKAAGFVDVKCEVIKMNLGVWAGEDGRLGRDITIGGLSGMRDHVMREGGCGRFSSASDFDRQMDEITDEWDDMEGSHTEVRVFTARKPL
ncbi:hypothetical protein JVU11DRAFT_10036 [Chiua virens]|nr:hypothetical protein JVU11DRAFT_10036 [Chiua virens]